MKHKLRRVLAVTAALSLTMMFSMTAHAGGGPEYPVREDQEVILRAPDIPADDTAETYTPPQQDTSTQTPSGSKTEEAKPLTPEGNMTLVDDVESKTEEDKQFITVVTKNGDYFYIIIDRAEEGENTVHFLNQVDEEDLLALMETEEKADTPIVCSCTEKCMVGSIQTACQICMAEMEKCVGKEPEPQEPEQPEEPEEPAQENNVGAVLAVVLLLAAGGVAIYFLVIKPRNRVKVPNNYEDLNLEDEEYEEYETEDTE